MAIVERILREYQSTANKTHPCCARCFHDILPGERYECTVGVLDRHRLMILKMHIDCDWWDPDEDDELYRSEDDDENVPLPEAA